METKRLSREIHPIWWAVAMFVAIAVILLVCLGFFAGTFRSYIPVTLVSDRSGLVMESGAKVKLRGVDVGRVSGIVGGKQPVSLKLEIDPDQVRYIPANVQAEIKATTAFGAKYVDLIYPENPSGKRIAAGAVLRSRNVATEVNTVFDNLVGLLNQIDIAKLNSVLTALADGVRGKGARMGEALTDSDQVLQAINPRMDTVAANWRSFKGFNDAYGPAAKDILRALDAATTTSATINDHAKDLDTLLLSTTGFSNQGIELLGPNRDNLITGINSLEPTTSLLLKYNPELTCTIVGGRYFLDHGGREQIGGNGRTLVADAGLLFGDDLYSYPENLPIVAAKGGYNGEPSCGPLPDVKNNLPVRYLVTNTGWGTGLDMRPNPGLGHPCWVDFFPVTRGYSQPASLRQCLPGPAPGPAVPLGMPPYGAPWYGPDGAPLYPGVPPPPPPGPPSP